ncbi:hypothetical protein BDB00DRAFT_389575 [Zychaea mexicana]|uniref:uncharacterized protein n=1 Tax=Zychaea mexicana TaxID=64656 RepID=UPI0022FDB823|nr:uncharacterized protein BDB00DRAFT_389575 [Zychaea mexicana]KAI9498541.1 hypothetical protein BDB00DRAFT_389575 [Zychaea mexicana]
MEAEEQMSNNNNTTSTAAAVSAIEPILGSTVAGGLVTVHRISPALFDIFSALQDRLVHYASSMFIILGSSKNFYWFRGLSAQKQQQHTVIHGDLLTLYLRLAPEQQQEVIQLNLSKDDSQKQQVLFLNLIRAFLDATPTSSDEHGASLRQNLWRKRMAVSAATTVTDENGSEGNGGHGDDDINDDDEDDVELLYTYSGEIAWMMDRLLRAMERYC